MSTVCAGARREAVCVHHILNGVCMLCVKWHRAFSFAFLGSRAARGPTTQGMSGSWAGVPLSAGVPLFTGLWIS